MMWHPGDGSTAKVCERLAHTFGVRQQGHPRLRHRRAHPAARRPLDQLIPALPITAVPDFTALPIAVQEDGQIYALRLFGTQVLVVGATGSGKGSV
jgi:hypothetical protein